MILCSKDMVSFSLHSSALHTEVLKSPLSVSTGGELCARLQHIPLGFELFARNSTFQSFLAQLFSWDNFCVPVKISMPDLCWYPSNFGVIISMLVPPKGNGCVKSDLWKKIVENCSYVATLSILSHTLTLPFNSGGKWESCSLIA